MPSRGRINYLGKPWGTCGSYTFAWTWRTGEGQKAARKLAREAVLRGVPVHIMDDGAYGGYSEPSDQWEAEGRVTLDGAELELCQECKAPIHYYDPDGAPYCEPHSPGL